MLVSIRDIVEGAFVSARCVMNSATVSAVAGKFRRRCSTHQVENISQSELYARFVASDFELSRYSPALCPSSPSLVMIALSLFWESPDFKIFPIFHTRAFLLEPERF